MAMNTAIAYRSAVARPPVKAAPAASPSGSRHVLVVWLGFFTTLAAMAVTTKTLVHGGPVPALIVAVAVFVPLLAVVIMDARAEFNAKQG